MSGTKNKIGIITFHRAYNYGSVLQAYALNYYLNKLGITTETIDFWTERQKDIYRIFEPNKSVMSILRNIQSLMQYSKLVRKKKRFEAFIEENIVLSKGQYKTLEDLREAQLYYDYYICGGDQVWNPYCEDFDYAYLLDFVDNKKKCMSFSPSIAVTDMGKKEKEAFEKVKDFKALSVREATGKGLLEKLVNREVEVISDPVILLDKKEWMKFVDTSFPLRNYVFCYFIGDVKGMREYAKKLGKQGKKVIVIQKSIRDMLFQNRKMYDAGPKEFLTLLYHADYVITDSYHATIFSTMFHKKFWTFLKPEAKTNSNSRIVDFAEKFGVSNRIVSYENPRISECSECIDYKKAEEQFEIERKKSIEYLRKLFL